MSGNPPRPAADHPLPGSDGEHRLQRELGTERRAHAFYEHQVLDHLSERMRSFIAGQEMMFVSTADAAGNCDCSIRAGLPGFVCVAGERTLAYPEYRGNGVMASLGNLSENAHVGLLFIDFFASTVGCHVNGTARIVENNELLAADTPFPEPLRRAAHDACTPTAGGRTPERWVVVHVEEAYIHCSKHIPLLAKRDKAIPWGTDDLVAKGGDFFGAKNLPRPWRRDTRLVWYCPSYHAEHFRWIGRRWIMVSSTSLTAIIYESDLIGAFRGTDQWSLWSCGLQMGSFCLRQRIPAGYRVTMDVHGNLPVSR